MPYCVRPDFGHGNTTFSTYVLNTNAFREKIFQEKNIRFFGICFCYCRYFDGDKEGNKLFKGNFLGNGRSQNIFLRGGICNFIN